MKPIDIMIAGAPKCGTTSLLRNLAAHPSITTHRQAEFGYFWNDNTYAAGYAQALKRFFGKNIRQVLLAKHVRLMYSHKAIQRLYEHNPNVYVVVILRNPVDRAYSEYWYSRRQGWETLPTFEEAIRMEEHNTLVGWLHGKFPRSYLFHSIYCPHIKRLIEVFGREQVVVFFTEDLKQNAFAVYEKILAVKGLSGVTALDVAQYNRAARPRSEKLAQIYSKIVYAPDSSLKRVLRKFVPKYVLDNMIKVFVAFNQKPFEVPPMDAGTRRYLQSYFEPHNLCLERLLGIDLSHWNQ